MGRIAKFFGCPGDRPALHHQAPLIQHDQEIIQQLKHSIKHINTNNDNKLKSSRETLVGEQEDDDKASTDDTISLSDASTKLDLADVLLQDDGYINTNMSFTGLRKSYMDRTLDKLVIWAGTQIMFFLMWIILIIWVVIGAVYNAPFNWQVVMQDGQSIQCYFWDTLLTRQQLTSTHEQVLMVTQLRSRLQSFKTFLLGDDVSLVKPANIEEEGKNNNTITTTTSTADASNIKYELRQDEELVDTQSSCCGCDDDDDDDNEKKKEGYNIPIDHDAITGALPTENWYDKTCTAFSWMIGSVPCMVLFWICIFIWIGCGAIPQNGEKFSDNWQMEINTATAVCLLISSFFLQNIRARHDLFTSKFLFKIHSMDNKIDLILRTANNDFTSENPVITVNPSKRTKAEHVIDWYADVVGTGIGIVVAICVFATWAGIGSPLHWSDDWWLIIGTYTGLVGFLDGFVIRQVYFRIIKHEEEHFQHLADEDSELFQLLSINCPEEYLVVPTHKKTLSYKISEFVNLCCSTQWSVLVSVLIIVGLICAASGMLWSTTGQLIANTPTMIIEEFFLIVLIQAHNWADEQRRIEISCLFARRHILLNYVQNRYVISPSH